MKEQNEPCSECGSFWDSAGVLHVRLRHYILGAECGTCRRRRVERLRAAFQELRDRREAAFMDAFVEAMRTT